MHRSAVVVLAGLAAGLAGCAHGTSSVPAAPALSTTAPALSTTVATTQATTTPTTTGPSLIGGMTVCTKEALAEPAAAAARALGPDNVYTVDDLHCADGWAVTSGLLASRANPTMGAPTSFVFEQEGQFWVVQDKTKVCGTNPTTTTAPADAAIPAALFLPGCAAG